MKLPYSGVILSGGLNTRFSGQNKSFLNINGKKAFDYVYEVLNDLFDETILVTNDPLSFLKWDIQIVTDMYAVRSPLIGIHAGLFAAKHPYVFVTACDTPFLKKAMIRAIINAIDPSFDVVVPQTPDGFQPLCAVYSKRCLSVLGSHLAKQAGEPNHGEGFQKALKIQYLFQKVRVKILSGNFLHDIDPDLISFFNVNTPQDLAKAQKIARQKTF